ncbi:MAG: 16S rRNA (uracil(1498)-N(3))-methyltransferase [Chloroflexota bacterium]|nr:MAG: 16S rRNA (uracil(1498)-N(3))-methyltransferase [Chloroflexota bacterium]
MLHRFFVSPALIQNGTVHFSRAQAHQLRDVLRMRAGDKVIALDNLGSEYRVVLQHLARDVAEGEIVEQRAATGEPQTQIILYQALLKADKFEWALQKGTEIGISAFAPIVTERSAQQVGKNKFARWSQIVTEAAEQAGRGKLPPLLPHQAFTDALDAALKAGGCLLIPYELETTSDLASALRAADAAAIHLFIGPEGGFSASEIEIARNHHAQIITLGPRILRAETAGLVTASAIFFARGDLNRI